MIIVECDLDEYLIRSLGIFKKQIKHQGGKGKVLRWLRRFQGNVGIIDEDPDSYQPSVLQEYKLIDKTENLKLLNAIKRSDKNQYLIIICPVLENWIVKRAIHNKINLIDYGFKPDAKSLHNIPHIEEKRNFRRFLADLISIDDEIATLKSWLVKYSKK